MAEINAYHGVDLNVEVDFACEVATPIVRCKQGDINRIINIYPRENGEKLITVTNTGEVIINPYNDKGQKKGEVYFRVQRPDGALYEVDTTSTHWDGFFEDDIEGTDRKVLNYVSFELSEDMLAVAGRAVCDVVFELGGYVHTVSVATFYVDIEAKPTATSSGGLSPTSPINIEEVAEESWGTFSPDLRTLYIVTGENSVKMYFGSTEVGGGRRSAVLQTANITNKAQSIVREVTQ